MTETVVRVPSFSVHCVTLKFSVDGIIVLPTILDCIIGFGIGSSNWARTAALHEHSHVSISLVIYIFAIKFFEKKNVNKRYTLTCKAVFYT